MSLVQVKPDTVVSRLERTAIQLTKQFSKSTDLLNVAVQEAIPWAGALATQGRIPRRDQLEKLTAQLLAILIASEVPPDTSNDTPPRASISRFGA